MKNNLKSDRIEHALRSDQTIDITTTGRKSGRPRRIEIWFHNLDGRVFITGLPGKRDWYANLLANPVFTFHLKESVQANLTARATPILEEDRRRAILSRITKELGRAGDLEAWVQDSPLVEVEFLG
jgi:deazaflavin-dependent oxidoreductase (nitroreductase family)